MSGERGSGRWHALVVDDSAVAREAIQALLLASGDFVVDLASDPLFALRKMENGLPDVIVLDLEMPRMDGLTFLRKLMKESPVPVVVCSGHVGGGTELAMQALDAGAIDLIPKPQLGVRDFLLEAGPQIVDAVRGAAQVRRFAKRDGGSLPATRQVGGTPGRRSQIVALGASTGGPSALRDVLMPMPSDTSPMLVVQHMPAGFTRAFADRLNRDCAVHVKEAQNGDRVVPGHVLVAPGSRHMRLERDAQGFRVSVSPGPLVSRHCPSVDVLFESVAAHAGTSAIGVLMTGMGDDGARGLEAMRKAGATTIAQDEASCAVFGMPKEAIDRGAVEHVVALDRIAALLLRLTRAGKRGTS